MQVTASSPQVDQISNNLKLQRLMWFFLLIVQLQVQPKFSISINI